MSAIGPEKDSSAVKMQRKMEPGHPETKREQPRPDIKGRNIQDITNRFGLNPHTRYDTPAGIYGYPFTAEYLDRLLYSKGRGKSLPFKHTSRFAHVFQILLKYQDKILKLSTVTQSDYEAVWAKLDAILRTALLKFESESDQETEAFLDKLRKIAETSAYKNTPASTFWNLTRLAAGFLNYTSPNNLGKLKKIPSTVSEATELLTNINTKSTATWGKLLLSLGYAGIWDDSCQGIIYRGEPCQMVVFSNAYTSVKHVIDTNVIRKEKDYKHIHDVNEDDEAELLQSIPSMKPAQLRKYFRHPSEKVRAKIASTLPVKFLVKMTKDPSENVRLILTQRGSQTLLKALVKDDSAKVRELVARLISPSGLRLMVDDDSAKVRFEVVQRLHRLSDTKNEVKLKNNEIASLLEKSVHAVEADTSESVSNDGDNTEFQTLSLLAFYIYDLVPKSGGQNLVNHLLSKSNPRILRVGIQLLYSRVLHKDKALLDKLLPYLQHEDPAVRKETVNGLIQHSSAPIPGAASDVKEALKKAIADPDPHVFSEALKGVMTLDKTFDVGPLLESKVLTDKHKEAALVYANVRTKNLPRILEKMILGTEDATLRSKALNVLGRYGEEAKTLMERNPDTGRMESTFSSADTEKYEAVWKKVTKAAVRSGSFQFIRQILIQVPVSFSGLATYVGTTLAKIDNANVIEALALRICNGHQHTLVSILPTLAKNKHFWNLDVVPQEYHSRMLVRIRDSAEANPDLYAVVQAFARKSKDKWAKQMAQQWLKDHPVPEQVGTKEAAWAGSGIGGTLSKPTLAPGEGAKLVKEGKTLHGWDKYVQLVAEAYRRAPSRDAEALPSFQVLKKHTVKTFPKIRSRIKIEFVDGQPYETAEEMMQKVKASKTLLISRDFNQAGYFGPEVNLMFRAVHDYFAHMNASFKQRVRSFGIGGELEAYNKHLAFIGCQSKAVSAVFTEVIGQAAHFMHFGKFPNQKLVNLSDFDHCKLGLVQGYKIVDGDLVSAHAEDETVVEEPQRKAACTRKPDPETAERIRTAFLYEANLRPEIQDSTTTPYFSEILTKEASNETGHHVAHYTLTCVKCGGVHNCRCMRSRSNLPTIEKTGICYKCEPKTAVIGSLPIVRENDLYDALEHASQVYSDNEGFDIADFAVSPVVMTPVKELYDYDDIDPWLEFEPGELKKLGRKKALAELRRFRGNWQGIGEEILEWLQTGTFPPIVIIEGRDDEGRGFATIGDGRGRVNIAVGMGWEKVPVVKLVQKPRTASLKQAMPPVPEDWKGKVFYHGTPREDAAKSIMKQGLIVPPDLSKKPSHLTTPVEGKTYLSQDISYALIYALGANIAGHDMPKGWVDDKHGRYGYVFAIDASDMGDVQSDEDSVGELLHKLLNGKTDEPKWLLQWAESNVAETRLKRVKRGEYAYYAAVGKQILSYFKKSNPALLGSLLRYCKHIAHHGPVKPSAVWRVDKTKSKDFKADGSNFFEVAKKLPWPKAPRVKKTARTQDETNLRQAAHMYKQLLKYVRENAEDIPLVNKQCYHIHGPAVADNARWKWLQIFICPNGDKTYLTSKDGVDTVMLGDPRRFRSDVVLPITEMVRLGRGKLIHEFTHYIDQLRMGPVANEKAMRNYKEVDTSKPSQDYFNHPIETNAYFQTVAEKYQTLLDDVIAGVTQTEDVGRHQTDVWELHTFMYRAFTDFRHEFWLALSRGFRQNLTEKTKRAVLKRIYDIYKRLTDKARVEFDKLVKAKDEMALMLIKDEDAVREFNETEVVKKTAAMSYDYFRGLAGYHSSKVDYTDYGHVTTVEFTLFDQKRISAPSSDVKGDTAIEQMVKPAIVGAITFILLRNIEIGHDKWKKQNIAVVHSVAAKPGYGPFLYDLAMSLAVRGYYAFGMTSDRSHVSKAAKVVWRKYFESRPDVTKVKFPTEQWQVDQQYMGIDEETAETLDHVYRLKQYLPVGDVFRNGKALVRTLAKQTKTKPVAIKQVMDRVASSYVASRINDHTSHEEALKAATLSKLAEFLFTKNPTGAVELFPQAYQGSEYTPKALVACWRAAGLQSVQDVLAIEQKEYRGSGSVKVVQAALGSFKIARKDDEANLQQAIRMYGQLLDYVSNSKDKDDRDLSVYWKNVTQDHSSRLGIRLQVGHEAASYRYSHKNDWHTITIKRPLGSVYAIVTQSKDAIIHELTHYLDRIRLGNQNADKAIRNFKRVSPFGKVPRYVNHPVETNAFFQMVAHKYQEELDSYLEDMKNIEDDEYASYIANLIEMVVKELSDPRFHDYFLRDLSPSFVEALTLNKRKSLLKRIYDLQQRLLGKARAALKEINARSSKTVKVVQAALVSTKIATTKTVTLWRAAKDDFVTSGISFSESKAAARMYHNNPGYGGKHLFKIVVEVREDEVLDLTGMSEREALNALCKVSGLRYPGAIGPDEWVPRIAKYLADNGIAWVRVDESFPQNTITWIWTGVDGRSEVDDAISMVD